MPVDREEQLARVTSELEALEAHLPEYEDALARLERDRLGRLVVQHAGRRDDALEFAGQLEQRLGATAADTPEYARYQGELEKQRALVDQHAEAVREALTAGGFASESEARAARLPTSEAEQLKSRADLFATRYNATLQRYLDLGGAVDEADGE